MSPNDTGCLMRERKSGIILVPVNKNISGRLQSRYPIRKRIKLMEIIDLKSLRDGLQVPRLGNSSQKLFYPSFFGGEGKASPRWNSILNVKSFKSPINKQGFLYAADKIQY